MIPHRTFTRCHRSLLHLTSSRHLLSTRHNTSTTTTTSTKPTSPSKPIITGHLKRGIDPIPAGYLESITPRHLAPEIYARDITPEFVELAKGGCRTLILTRDSKRNALNLDMIRFMNQHLKAYALSEDVLGVIVRSNSEKFFCDGGDIKSLYDAGQRRKAEQLDTHDLTRTFFREEYRLNYRISRMKQAYIAVLNGSTMGGGAGISVNGRYRVATKNTVFAMPETAIGFFPDVGASYFLSRLESNLGIFLGLTGYRLTGADVVHIGLATHYGLPGQDNEIEFLLSGEEIFHRDFADKAMNIAFPEFAEVQQPPFANVLEGHNPNHPYNEAIRAAYILKTIRNQPVAPIPAMKTRLPSIQIDDKIIQGPMGPHALSATMDEYMGFNEQIQQQRQQEQFVGNTTERSLPPPPLRSRSAHAKLLVKAFIENPINRYHPAKLWYEGKNVYLPFTLTPVVYIIDRCFNQETIELIMQALNNEIQLINNPPHVKEFARQQLETLNKMSPTSLKVTLRMLRAGKMMSLKDCLKMEYRIAQRMMMKEDFYIGVDAALISKHRKPVWSATLSQVTDQMVDAYFAPFSTDPTHPEFGEKELDLEDLDNPDRID